MVDYCMCNGDGCSVKAECARYRFKPCPYAQSYFAETPGKDKDCDYFMSLGTRENLRSVEDIENEGLKEKDDNDRDD
tara:strand:+ start:8149 stop:8379 length:231 start_codon:yes stop_codon:yes gene_type:complete